MDRARGEEIVNHYWDEYCRRLPQLFWCLLLLQKEKNNVLCPLMMAPEKESMLRTCGVVLDSFFCAGGWKKCQTWLYYKGILPHHCIIMMIYSAMILPTRLLSTCVLIDLHVIFDRIPIQWQNNQMCIWSRGISDRGWISVYFQLMNHISQRRTSV